MKIYTTTQKCNKNLFCNTEILLSASWHYRIHAKTLTILTNFSVIKVICLRVYRRYVTVDLNDFCLLHSRLMCVAFLMKRQTNVEEGQ